MGWFLLGTIPSRLESIILGVFVVTIAVCAVNIHHIPNNPKEPIMAEELCDLIATRTGIVTLYLVPLLVLFAGRNNFMQWLTGWKFSTHMMYHRWISRVPCLGVYSWCHLYSRR